MLAAGAADVRACAAGDELRDIAATTPVVANISARALAPSRTMRRYRRGVAGSSDSAAARWSLKIRMICLLS